MLIYEMLKKDHENVKDLLEDLVSLSSDDQNRSQLIEEIRAALIPHSRAEESVLYNSLRTLDSAKNIVMHGYQEHVEAEAMLRALQVRDRVDLEWKKTALRLQSALHHHIFEEEEKIFPIAQEIFSDEEAEMMGRAFAELKDETKDEGFMKTTLDLIVNLMPPRFKPLGNNRDLRL